MLNEEQSVNSKGNAPNLPVLTTAKVIENFGGTAKKHTKHRFLRMVYVRKDGRSIAEQKEAAMQQVIERYVRLVAHSTYTETDQSSRHKKTIYCHFRDCS